VLEGRGYVVREATHGLEALSAALLDPIDVVVANVMLPAVSAAGLARLLHREPATVGIPVIAIAPSQTVGPLTAVLTRGADDVLQSPVWPDVLGARVAAALTRTAREQQRANRARFTAACEGAAARHFSAEERHLRCARLFEAFASTHTPMLLVDSRGGILDVNAPAEALLGTTRTAIDDVPIDRLLSPAGDTDAWTSALRSDDESRIQARYAGTDGGPRELSAKVAEPCLDLVRLVSIALI